MVTPHKLRHTCATHLLQEGAHLVSIQKLLSHKSLPTSQEERRLHIIALGKETFTTHRSRLQMETKLARIAAIAKQKPKERFTSLYHLLPPTLLGFIGNMQLFDSLPLI